MSEWETAKPGTANNFWEPTPSTGGRLQEDMEVIKTELAAYDAGAGFRRPAWECVRHVLAHCVEQEREIARLRLLVEANQQDSELIDEIESDGLTVRSWVEGIAAARRAAFEEAMQVVTDEVNRLAAIKGATAQWAGAESVQRRLRAKADAEESQ